MNCKDLHLRIRDVCLSVSHSFVICCLSNFQIPTTHLTPCYSNFLLDLTPVQFIPRNKIVFTWVSKSPNRFSNSNSFLRFHRLTSSFWFAVTVNQSEFWKHIKKHCWTTLLLFYFKRHFTAWNSTFIEIRNTGRWGWRTVERRTEAANSHSSRYRSGPENSFVGWSDVGSWHWKRVYCAISAGKCCCW